MAEEEPIRLSVFKSNLVRPNSILTIIGKKTNIKSIYKDYGKYFENVNQLKNIMDTLKEGESLLIDETSPKNQITELLYIYK